VGLLTEHADFDGFELLEERLPPRLVRRGKVDDERLGLNATTAAARLDYLYSHVNEEQGGEAVNKGAPISSTTASSLA